jgi:SAM-dependent MidA family methyltransferase
LLDNLPVDLYERKGRRWYAVCVALSHEGGFAEELMPVEDDEVVQKLRFLVPDAADGTRVPLQQAATDWLQSAFNVLDRGRVVLFDYARTTRWMARHEWEDWLRTYRGHRPGGAPLESPGTQDITCEVAIDQLMQVRRPDKDRSQTDFLEDHGLIDLMTEARAAWHTRAAMGDLGAARARSRVNEGRALTDPNGLGRYRVLEWEVPGKEAEEAAESAEQQP